MAWLRDIEWPFQSAVFDCEACAGDGHEGIQAVFAERKRRGGDMALVLFEVSVRRRDCQPNHQPMLRQRQAQ
jgi:hypothetical protein